MSSNPASFFQKEFERYARAGENILEALDTQNRSAIQARITDRAPLGVLDFLKHEFYVALQVKKITQENLRKLKEVVNGLGEIAQMSSGHLRSQPRPLDTPDANTDSFRTTTASDAGPVETTSFAPSTSRSSAPLQPTPLPGQGLDTMATTSDRSQPLQLSAYSSALPTGQYPSQAPRPQQPSSTGQYPSQAIRPQQPSSAGQYPSQAIRPQQPSSAGQYPSQAPRPQQPSSAGQYPSQAPRPQQPSSAGQYPSQAIRPQQPISTTSLIPPPSEGARYSAVPFPRPTNVGGASIPAGAVQQNTDDDAQSIADDFPQSVRSSDSSLMSRVRSRPNNRESNPPYVDLDSSEYKWKNLNDRSSK